MNFFGNGFDLTLSNFERSYWGREYVIFEVLKVVCELYGFEGDPERGWNNGLRGGQGLGEVRWGESEGSSGQVSWGEVRWGVLIKLLVSIGFSQKQDILFFRNSESGFSINPIDIFLARFIAILYVLQDFKMMFELSEKEAKLENF